MKNVIRSLSLLLGGAALAACSSSSTPTNDGGVPDAKTKTEAGPPGAQYVLVTANNKTTSETLAVNVATKQIEGSLMFTGDLGSTFCAGQPLPFLLEESQSVVARLDSTKPWVIDASWNVLGTDAVDGGYAYSDPIAVLVGGGGSAYVLRYDRNVIDVIDTSQAATQGKPTATIDLSSLVQGMNGFVYMSSGLYVAAKNMLYVVLENIDENHVSADGEFLYCTAGTTSSVVGIDTKTNALASLGGAGTGGSVVLQGYNPVPGGLAYDAANDRILLFEEGCYAAPATADGGAGARSLGGVEAVSLSDLSTTILLDISSTFPLGSGYPSGISIVSSDDVVLGFDFTGSEVYHWNPSSKTLGAKIPNAPDTFVYDGKGNLLGTSTTYDDAGTGTTTVVSVSVASGVSTPLTKPDPFTMSGGFIGGVDVWPQP
jgi:hypothetical protein